MKKFLLSMAMVLTMAIGASAQTIIETNTLTKDGNNASVSKDGFTVLIEKKDGTTAPALRNDGSVRVYAKGTVTVSGNSLTKIVFTLASDAAARYTTFTPSVGALNPAQAAGDTEINWEGDAATVTFTVGDLATWGTDGATKAGQIRLSKITIYGEGGEVVDPDPQPTGEKYTLATTMAAGDYAIAFGTKVATTLAESKTYGYLPVVDGTLDGTTLTTDAPVYTFEAAEGGYYIKDALGRYLIQTGTFNSFNLSETATEEGIFTVSLAADGTATIVNTNVSKTMGYSEQFNSVGSYPTTDGYVMPKLYVKESGSEPEPDPQPTGEKYNLTTAMAAGDYAIAFGTKVATTLAESKSYGYLPVVDGTLDGTTLTTEAPVYTFETAEGGYYIKDALGRYLIQTGTFNSFNLSETATEEGIFTVSLAADGTATIVNTNVSKTMGYSEQFNSVGSYPTTDGYVMPKLYTKSQTGITDITADEDAPVEYYNLQGIRVANPENGIYVRRQGNSVSKVYVK